MPVSGEEQISQKTIARNSIPPIEREKGRANLRGMPHIRPMATRSDISRARALDKFYTLPGVVESCLDDVATWTGLDLRRATCALVEPSAGGGAFLDALPPHTKAYDIAPEHPRVVRRSFLTLDRKAPAFVVGNPPFGKNAHLAVAFFNHAARFATHIAFIVPRTFQKASVHRRLDPAFHLVGERVLAPESFAFEGRPVAVPCVFQVWERRATPRPCEAPPISHPDFVFCRPEEARFAIQRVGVRAGTVKDTPAARSPNSHLFVRPLAEPTLVESRFRSLPVDKVRLHTAGNPSLSKREIVALYTEVAGPAS